MTVKDLNLTEDQAEYACFLLNYRGKNYDRTAFNWGKMINLHEFTVEELKDALAVDDEITAANPIQFKKTESAGRVFAQLRKILKTVASTETEIKIIYRLARTRETWNGEELYDDFPTLEEAKQWLNGFTVHIGHFTTRILKVTTVTTTEEIKD